MGKPEGYVEDYLVKQAEKHDFLCYKFTSPGRRGMPDRILIANGRTIFVECKSKDGCLSKLQKLTIAKMRRQGAEVWVTPTRTDVDILITHCLNTKKGG